MLCGPCKAQGKKEAAVVSCNECENELLCVGCKTRHSVQLITRKHVLQALEIEEDMPTNASDEDRELFCDQCKAMNKTSIASVFCSDCENQLLCFECEGSHRSLKITKEHKLHDVSCYGNVTEGYIANAVTTVTPEIVKNTEYTPGRPTAISVSSDSITLQWSTPEAFKDGDYFQLCYREKTSKKWKTSKETITGSVQTIPNLKSETQYIFRVRVIHNDLEGPYSDLSETVKTVQSAASIIIKRSSCKTDTTPNQFDLPMEQTERDPTTKIRAFELGSAQQASSVEKTIMMVGETGTGKSTLVDGMANYILGVRWDDPFRFKMVSLESEEMEKSTNQAISQTEWITRYTIHPLNGGRLKYSINIIDTPGFGDTRGIEHDQKIVKQIDKLFSTAPPKGVLNIDAICFLVKAPDGRLTTSQIYIFNSIMSIFGKDIAENICSLITFADGNVPCVLAALVESGMPFGHHFMFNNSALFAKNTNKENSGMSRTFWEMGNSSFRTFFRFVESLPTKSLQLTANVLFERNRLELIVSNLDLMITAAIIKVQELKSEIDGLEKYRYAIQQNKNYTFMTKELRVKKEKLQSGENVTNCTHCHITCHSRCKRAKTNNKKGCWAMDKNGKCRICPNNCIWNVHVNETYRYIYVEEEVEKTLEEMKQKYETATGEAMNQEQVLAKKNDEMLFMNAQMGEMMNNVRRCNQRLAEIALRPNPLSEEEYIDKMIANERFEQRTGFTERISTLSQFKKRAKVPEMYEQYCSETGAPVLSGQLVFEYIKRTRPTMALIVVAIDFGTSSSGWAFSTNFEFKKDPTTFSVVDWISKDAFSGLKVPTCILIKPDGKTVEDFGYDAENRYSELVADEDHKDWYFFRRFKMKLNDTKDPIGKSTMLTDENGKELDALTVYSLSIAYLKDNFYDHLNNCLTGNLHTSDIHWVLTVPDIFNEPAKQFMKMSAQEAGIDINNLSFASEPAAASIYCLFNTYIDCGSKTSIISNFKTGKQYLVCDIGGGTFDIRLHEVTPDMKLKEIQNAIGEDWSGTQLDEEFEKYIDTLAGCHVMEAFKNKNKDDYLRFTRAFEVKKRLSKKSTSDGKCNIELPASFRDLVKEMTGKTIEEQVQRSKYCKTDTVRSSKLTCNLSVPFDEPIKYIIAKLTSILSRYVDKPIDHIIMTGGFSEFPLVQDAVREAFPTLHVSIPRNAILAVLGGALMLKHYEFERLSIIV